MHGLMMDVPLLITDLIRFADRNHGDTEIVSKTVEGKLHRYTYRDAHARARRLAKVLQALGVKTGDRIGTLAWNGYRHYELYYAISGIGAIINTINPRLFAEQIVYISNHAENQALFFDLTFVPLVEKLAPQLKTVKHFVLLTDRAHMPAKTSIPKLLCYEELMEEQDDRFAWPSFDERTAAALCYTSGTTGNPKGVLFGHRSTVLHA
ncbi:MAG: AMP-binding protein, partial [Betaproteobacteria bacterium]|nr:AMP-binding protein [Betaproteobacteria bacterium]